MSKVLELNKTNFSAEVLGSQLPVLVDFWAPWCNPCKIMAPILEELSNELEGRVKVAKINAEDAENLEIAEKYQIQSLPNLKLFKDGRVAGEFTGLRNKETLKNDLAAFLP